MRVFDSNILIYHLNDALPSSVLNRVESWITEGAVISVISRIEVLGHPQTSDQLQQAMRLLAYFEEIPLHEPVVQRTISLRQQYRIRVPDALIAAIVLDLVFRWLLGIRQIFSQLTAWSSSIHLHEYSVASMR